MILVDFSHISHPQCIVAWNNYVNDNADFEVEYRSRVLYVLYEVFKKHDIMNEEIVLCIDGRNNWRKQAFPNYKAKRKTNREKSGIDWTFCYKVINEFITELKEKSLFTIIEIDKAEADDVIGVLARYNKNRERIILISSDKDFKQLHDAYELTQFNYKGVQVVPEFNAKDECEIITLTGDVSDGVPNVFSHDDVYVDEDIKPVRFGPKTAQKIIQEHENTIKKWGTLKEIKQTDKYKRNKMLVDLSQTPDDIKNNIIELYDNYKIVGSLPVFKQYVKNINSYVADHIQYFNTKPNVTPKWAKFI